MSRLAALAALSFALSASAQDRPLTAMPYTPSLEPKYMDRSVDPCSDFYRYACGNWIKVNPMPADQSRWNVYGKLYQDNIRFLWGLLEEAEKPSATRTKVEQETGDFFHSCMDEETIAKLGAAPLKSVLAEIAGLKNLAGLTEFVARQHLETVGDGLLFGFGSGQDFADSSRVIAFVNAGGLGLPDRDYYTKTDDKSVETRKKYVEHVARMLKLAGEVPAKAEDILRMETALAKVALTRVEKRNPKNLNHRMKFADLAKLTPSIDWKRYIAIEGVSAKADVNVTEPKFFEELDRQLKAESLDNWKAYLKWHAIHSRANYLAADFDQENFAFYNKYLRGTPQMPPRWKRCVQMTDRMLGEALGQVFVAKTFDREAKAQALDVTKQIEAAMERDIKDITWMSDVTKAQALTKLHTIVNKIGYPDKWRDYSAARIVPDDFAGNAQRLTVVESKRQVAKIGRPVERGEWMMSPPTVNAYYDPQMNDINFPAGVLQPPLFDLKTDAAPNYGDTGATIGHELTHGFDDEGRQFDAKGNLHDWWTDADGKAFEERAQCIVDQFAQYTVVDDIKINSKLTLGEDIADLGGTYLAFVAWKRSVEGKKLEPLDGLSPEQRFFVGNAQWACGDERPEQKRLGALTDPHSPDEYRVNGVFANMPEFREAFGCKVGQPMAREKACKVW